MGAVPYEAAMKALSSMETREFPPNAAQVAFAFPAAPGDKPLDGRLLLLLSNDDSDEPRMQIALR